MHCVWLCTLCCPKITPQSMHDSYIINQKEDGLVENSKLIEENMLTKEKEKNIREKIRPWKQSKFWSGLVTWVSSSSHRNPHIETRPSFSLSFFIYCSRKLRKKQKGLPEKWIQTEKILAWGLTTVLGFLFCDFIVGIFQTI